MIAAVYARKSTGQNVADQEKRTRAVATPKRLVDLTRFLEIDGAAHPALARAP